MQPVVIRKMINRFAQSLINNQCYAIPIIGGKQTILREHYLGLT